jgi:hypothetical protein
MASADKPLDRRPSLDQSTETEPTRPYIYAPLLTEYPARVICPNCHAQVLTRTTHENGFLTWLFASGLFLLGFSYYLFVLKVCKFILILLF